MFLIALISMQVETKPLPLLPLPANHVEDRRLWLGNLDPHVTEKVSFRGNELAFVWRESGKPFRENQPQCTSLLVFSSLVQHEIRPCGYQRPSAGQPRGYAFVTFVACTDANKARTILDGKLLGCKHVMVRWANTVSKEELERHKPELKIPALAGAQNDKKLSRQTTIQAIEAKLKLMEHGCDDEFKVNNRPAGILYRPPPVIRDSSSTNSRLHRGRQQARPYRRSQRGQRR
uniref:RRM domain-containing protein n=1 Tax=Timema poppense TaxID=170557 RepID=A0A7R9CMW7_TIMPO|nr:unnamed protein product [Timema poppensis]